MLAIELINVKIYVHLNLFIAISYICMYMFSRFFAVDLISPTKMNKNIFYMKINRKRKKKN